VEDSQTGVRREDGVNLLGKLDITIYYLLMLYALASSISIAAANITISLAALLAIVRHSKEPVPVIWDKSLVRAMGVFLVAVFISAVFAYKPSAGFDSLFADIYRMLPLFLAIAFIRDKEGLLKILIVMASSIFISDSYAIWQGTHGSYGATGFSGHIMMLAGYLVQMIPLLLIVGLENKFIGTKLTVFFVSTALISCVALLYNGTRGAWLAVFVTCLVYSTLSIKENKKIAISILTVCLCTGILAVNIPTVKERVQSLANFPSSSGDRLALWTSAWHMFQDHPLVGVGPGNFPVVYVSHYILPQAKEPNLVHAHNNFMHMLAETGILGICAFLYMFGYILVTMYHRYRLNSQDTWALAAFLVTISLLIQGMTEYNFGSSAVIRMYWFIMGIVYAAFRICDSSSD